MSVFVTADWVLPVSRRPIRNGGVLIDKGRVVEVARADELEGLAAGAVRKDFPGCILTPGLVNAHTHLSLSAMQGVLEPSRFEEWLPALVSAMRSWDNDDFAASAELGSRRCLEAGVTVVGDIVYGPEGPGAAVDAGLGGVFFWEVLGLKPQNLFARLEELEFPTAPGGVCGPRIRCGLSPHSVYTSGPDLLRHVRDTAVELGAPMAIHLAESHAEFELTEHGTGPLAATAARLANDFVAPGVGPVCYLDRLGVLDGATVIHLGETLPSDVARLAATARGAVTCPRSNGFLGNRVAPVSRLLRAGLPVGIGTDSAASNDDLDLIKEARTLCKVDVSLSSRTLVEMLTAMGAIALGVEDRYGILESGMQGDVAVFRLGETDDPEGDLIRLGGSDTIEAVFAGGDWRVLRGAPVQVAPELDARARRAASSAAAAVAGDAS